MVKAKVWMKVKEFSGTPTIDNLKLVEEELPELKDGGISIFQLFINQSLAEADINLKYFTQKPCARTFKGHEIIIPPGILCYKVTIRH